MAQRFVLQVCQLDPLWRVTVRDMGRLRPEFCREYPSQGEALVYATDRGTQMLALGETARVVLIADGTETVAWDSSDAAADGGYGQAGCPST